MSIVNLIVHEIQKKSTEKKAILVARPTENSLDIQAETLAEQIGHLFNRSGMNTGRFSNPEGSEEGAKLPCLLAHYFDGKQFSDFPRFTKECAEDFVSYIGDVEEAEGGLLWFNHYQLHDTQFLFIVLLKRKQGLILNTDLSLQKIEQIELDRLHMAMRINLTALQAQDDSRYISFRFGKAPKNESDYFTRFIGCNEPKAIAKETRKLVDLTSAYCQQQAMPVKQANEVKKAVAEHCLEKAEQQEPVNIKEMAASIESRFTPNQEGDFLTIADSESFALDKEMFVEKAALKKLTRYSGSNRALTISFDSELLGDSIRYDETTQSLIISDMPKTLLKQLQKS